MNDYFSKDGLLNSKIIFDKGTEENAPLWTVQYLLFDEYFQNEKEHHRILSDYAKWMFKCFVELGLYNQNIERKNNHDDYTSPDQLIGYICYHELIGMINVNRQIWSYLVTHLLTYDNLTAKINFKRIMQPMAIFTAAFAGSRLSVLFMPILSLILIATCFKHKDHTSGRLKALTIVLTFEMSITYKIMTTLINVDYKGGVEELFAIYFPFDDFPTRVALSWKK